MPPEVNGQAESKKSPIKNQNFKKVESDPELSHDESLATSIKNENEDKIEINFEESESNKKLTPI